MSFDWGDLEQGALWSVPVECRGFLRTLGVLKKSTRNERGSRAGRLRTLPTTVEAESEKVKVCLIMFADNACGVIVCL